MMTFKGNYFSLIILLNLTCIQCLSAQSYKANSHKDNLNLTQEVGISKDISHLKPAEDFIVYPNPSRGPLTIVSTGDLNTIEAVRIYESNGRLLHTELVNGSGTRLRPRLKPGLYMIVVQFIGKQKLGKKLIRII